MRRICCARLCRRQRSRNLSWWNRRWRRSLSGRSERKSMREILLIAKREYLEQVRGKAFKVTTILIPVIFAVVIGISVLAGKYSGSGKHLAVAANNLTLAEDVRLQLLTDKVANLNVDVIAPAADSDRQKLVDEVSQKQIDGFLWLTQDANGKTAAVYAGRSSGDFSTASRLDEAVDRAILQQQL